MGNKGVVYVLTNPSMPGYIKIGFTNDLRRRLRDLDTTGVARPFEPYTTVSTTKYKELEKVIHHELDKLTKTRTRINREFFELDPAVAGDLLQNLSVLIDDANVDSYGNTNEKDNLPNGLVKLISKPTTFKMLNIPIGSTLMANNKDFPVVVTVDDDNHVALPSGEIKTISRAVVDVSNTPRNGFQVYKYNGRPLTSMRKDIDSNYLPNSR